MRKYVLPEGISIAVIILLLLAGFVSPAVTGQHTQTDKPSVQTNNLEGAWRLTGAPGKNSAESITTLKLVQDGFFTVTVFDQKNRKFIGTYGGTYTLANGQLTEKYEFNSFDSTLVGKTKTGNYTLQNGKLETTGVGRDNSSETWQKVKEGNTNSPLSGTWRITAREQNGQMNTMRPGPRKTLKVLSDTRFQWIAFNTETGEFSGTGGGTYTATNGKYTEHIEFFSRDSSRVGMQLTFNFAVEDGKWQHSGQSSTGKPVNEVWQRISDQ